MQCIVVSVYKLRFMLNVYCSAAFNILLFMLEVVARCGFEPLQML